MNVEICSDQIIRVRIAPRDTFSESLLERYKILRTNWDAVDVSEKTSGDITKLFTPTHDIKEMKIMLQKTFIHKVQFHPTTDSVLHYL